MLWYLAFLSVNAVVSDGPPQREEEPFQKILRIFAVISFMQQRDGNIAHWRNSILLNLHFLERPEGTKNKHHTQRCPPPYSIYIYMKKICLIKILLNSVLMMLLNQAWRDWSEWLFSRRLWISGKFNNEWIIVWWNYRISGCFGIKDFKGIIKKCKFCLLTSLQTSVFLSSVKQKRLNVHAVFPRHESVLSY